jgi:cytochrome P450
VAGAPDRRVRRGSYLRLDASGVSVLDIDLDSILWSEWREDPAPLYRRLRDEHPVFHDAQNEMYLVTRYEDVDAVLKDYRRFSSTPTHMIDAERISPLREEDPPRHTFLRRIVMPLFTPREMRRLEAYFTEVARDLLDQAERGEVVDVSSQLAIPLPGRVTCDLLGVPLDRHERFLELTAERLALLGVSDGRSPDDGSLRPLDQIRSDLWGIVGPVVQARRDKPEHDAITFLVQAQDQHGRDQVSDEMIVDMLLHLLTGGFHTTQHLIESLISLLADRPDLWERMRENRALIPIAIEEMLRFDAPVQALRRRPIEDVVMHGVKLPRNSSVSMVYGSANRDERVFEDPDTFSLDRDVTRHMAFSAGIHYCPGAPVSRFEVRALFDEMLDRYVAIERAGSSERWPNNSRTVEAMHGFRSVPVHFRPADA